MNERKKEGKCGRDRGRERARGANMPLDASGTHPFKRRTTTGGPGPLTANPVAETSRSWGFPSHSPQSVSGRWHERCTVSKLERLEVDREAGGHGENRGSSFDRWVPSPNQLACLVIGTNRRRGTFFLLRFGDPGTDERLYRLRSFPGTGRNYWNDGRMRLD